MAQLQRSLNLRARSPSYGGGGGGGGVGDGGGGGGGVGDDDGVDDVDVRDSFFKSSRWSIIAFRRYHLFLSCIPLLWGEEALVPLYLH